MPQFFDEQASGSQYGTSGVASTCSCREHKDATDLVVTATGPVTHTLKADGFDGSEDGTCRGTPIVPMAFSPLQGGRSMPCLSVAPTLEAGTGNKAPAIAFHPPQDPISSVEVTHAMGTRSRQGTATVAVAIPLQDGRELDKKQNGLGVGSIGDPAYTLDTLGQQAVATVAVAIPIISDADRAESSAQTPSPDAEGRVRLRDPGLGIGNDGDPMFTLQATKPHAIAFAQNTRDEVRLIGGDGQTVGALAAQPGMKQTTYLATAYAVHGEHSTAMQSSNPATLVARPVEVARCLDTTGGYATSQGGTVIGQEITGTLSSRATAGGGLGTDFEVAGGLQPTSQPAMAVRRLLPIECEFLQGFPANWTLIPWKNKPASECPDGPRYKAMGNSMAVPVMRFIGERLDRVVRGEL